MAEGIITRRGGGAQFIQATGGTESIIEQDGELFRVHTFNSSGTFDVTRGGNVEYLVVGGGGGAPYGGGGGGGFVHHDPNYVVSSGQSIQVVVGDGGVGGLRDGEATDGESSEFGGITAFGGFAPDDPRIDGGDGGSGGGAGASSQGFAGGNGGTNGSNGFDAQGGNIGGTGQGESTTFFGFAFSGGGGGRSRGDVGAPDVQAFGGNDGGGDGGIGSDSGTAEDSTGNPGLPNSGGGGGAGARSRVGGNYQTYPGGDGGSGIVIVRYRIG